MKKLSKAILVWLLAGSATAFADAAKTNDLPRSDPEAQGIPSRAIQAFAEAAEAKIDAVHSLMVRAARQGGRRRLVGALREERPARDVLAQQELHVDGGRPRDRGRKADARRQRARRLPRGRARDRERQPEGDAAPRPAEDEHRPARGRRLGLPLRLGRHADARVPVAAGRPQAGHALLVQHARDLHGVGHGPEGDRPDRARLPAPAPLRSARDHGRDLGREQAGDHARRLRPPDPDRGHRALRPALPAEGRVAGQAAALGRLDRRGDGPSDLERQQPDERLGAGLRLPVLALPPRALPRRRRLRSVLHRDAEAGRRRRDHERHARPRRAS